MTRLTFTDGLWIGAALARLVEAALFVAGAAVLYGLFVVLP